MRQTKWIFALFAVLFLCISYRIIDKLYINGNLLYLGSDYYLIRQADTGEVVLKKWGNPLGFGTTPIPFGIFEF